MRTEFAPLGLVVFMISRICRLGFNTVGAAWVVNAAEQNAASTIDTRGREDFILTIVTLHTQAVKKRGGIRS